MVHVVLNVQVHVNIFIYIHIQPNKFSVFFFVEFSFEVNNAYFFWQSRIMAIKQRIYLCIWEIYVFFVLGIRPYDSMGIFVAETTDSTESGFCCSRCFWIGCFWSTLWGGNVTILEGFHQHLRRVRINLSLEMKVLFQILEDK